MSAPALDFTSAASSSSSSSLSLAFALGAALPSLALIASLMSSSVDPSASPSSASSPEDSITGGAARVAANEVARLPLAAAGTVGDVLASTTGEGTAGVLESDLDGDKRPRMAEATLAAAPTAA